MDITNFQKRVGDLLAFRVRGDQFVELAHGAIEFSRDVVRLSEPILRIVGEFSVREFVEKLLK